MANCHICGAETVLYENNIPICMKCVRVREHQHDTLKPPRGKPPESERVK